MTPTEQPDEAAALEEILRDLFNQTGIKLTEIGWELAEEQMQDAVAKLLERIQTAKAEAYERGVHDGRFNPTRKSELSAEELREYNRLAKQRSRQRSRAQLKAGEE